LEAGADWMVCVRAEDALAAAAAAAAASDKMRSVTLSVPLPLISLKLASVLRWVLECAQSWLLLSACVQGRDDPEGGAEDGRRPEETRRRLGGLGDRRRVGVSIG
jgi:hypothetical protein